jgi:protein-S-isoprenylcysteine O-methyltransferase Ste14
MERLLLFGLLSLPSLIFSWRALFSIKSHGFYRFFSWECIIWMFSGSYLYWFQNPLSLAQLFSWTLLFVSLYLLFVGAVLIIGKGKPSEARVDKTLFSFEKTTGLVDSGIYKYIRHPIYSSLIYLTWGIFLKHISIENLVFAILSTVFLYITSKNDEKECILYFGDNYKNYMKRSKMFIPFIF